MHLNEVRLIGRLGKDPEVKEITGGKSVANFSLCTCKKFKDKEGVQQERVEWHNIVAWGKTATLCGSYLKKGHPVYIAGETTNRSWDDKEGNKKYITEVIANNVQFLQPKSSNGQQESAPVVEDDLPF